MGAGARKEVLSFQARQEIDDGAGNPTSGPWVEQCKASAEIAALRGSEAVMGSRLEGVQPYLVSIRHSVGTAAITPDWRAVDVRSGATYAIKTAVTRPRRDYIDLVCVVGVAE